MPFSKKIRFLLLAFLTFIVASPVLAASWKPFSPQDGYFSVLMPSRPSFRQTNEKSAAGNIETNIYTSKVKGEEYTAEYSKLPGVAVFFGGSNKIFDGAKKGFLNNGGYQEVSFNDISFPGAKAAKELIFKSNDGQTGKTRFLLQDKILYVVIAKAASDKNFEKYFSSFKILGGE